jgi:hypothetical protein
VPSASAIAFLCGDEMTEGSQPWRAPRKIVRSTLRGELQASCCHAFRGTISVSLGIFRGALESFRQISTGRALAALVVNLTTAASTRAQPFKMTTPIAPGVAMPHRLDTSIGTLNPDRWPPQAGERRKDLRQPALLQGPAGLSAGPADCQPGGHARFPAQIRPRQQHQCDLGDPG